MLIPKQIIIIKSNKYKQGRHIPLLFRHKQHSPSLLMKSLSTILLVVLALSVSVQAANETEYNSTV